MHFHRHELAQSIAKALVEPDIFSDIRNGLFLTAPSDTKLLLIMTGSDRDQLVRLQWTLPLPSLQKVIRRCNRPKC